MANRKKRAPTRTNPPWIPPDDVVENDGPVKLPDLDYAHAGEVMRWAFDQGASYRRFAWACVAVCDFVVRRLEAARLLEDDRPEAIVASARRWCLREAPDDALNEAAGETTVAWAAAFEKGRSRYLDGVAAISDLLSDAFMRWKHRYVPYVDLSLDSGMANAARAISERNADDAASRAEVLRVFEAAFSERMRDRVDNPTGRRGEVVRSALPLPGDVLELRFTPWQSGFSVEAFAAGDPPSRPTAYVEVRPFRRLLPGCAADFERLRARLRLPTMGRLRLHESQVDLPRRREGLGVALYATALREAAERYGAALSSDDCDGGGLTSQDARRVWASRRLRSLSEAEGQAFYWRHPARAENPSTKRPLAAERVTIRVDLVEDTSSPDSDDPPEMRVATVSAINEAGEDVGGIDIEPAACVIGDCLDDLAALEEIPSVRRLKGGPFVTISRIDDAYRNRGLGIELYATAAWFVTRRLGGVLVAHHCGGYETSDEARRVWASRRFRSMVSGRGLVGAWTAKRDLGETRAVDLPAAPKKARRRAR